jgi:sirohydrochlorin cobaltochelatase
MSIDLKSAQGTRDCGLLLVGHGSQEAIGTAEFLATVELVAQAARGLAVEPCFLEFARPTIAEGFRALAARDVRRIVAVPVLLFSAGHAQRDIPAALAAVAAEHPQIAVEQVEHLGCHEALLALSKSRYDETLAANSDVPADETGLAMVGRGSHDPLAKREMLRFVQLRREASSLGYASACFLSMAEPGIETVLDELAQCGAKRVVVQPHLLFGGVLLDRIARIVEQYAERYTSVQWLTAGHLGPSPLLVQAIFYRARVVRSM